MGTSAEDDAAYDVADGTDRGAESAALAVDGGGRGVRGDWRAAATRLADDGGAGGLEGLHIILSHGGGHDSHDEGHKASESSRGAHTCKM